MKKNRLVIGFGAFLCFLMVFNGFMAVSGADITVRHEELWGYDIILFDEMNYTGKDLGINTTAYNVFGEEAKVHDDGHIKDDLKLSISYSITGGNETVMVTLDVVNITDGMYNASLSFFFGSSVDSISSSNVSTYVTVAYHVSSRIVSDMEINIDSLLAEAYANQSLSYSRYNLALRCDNVSQQLIDGGLTAEGDEGVFDSKVRLALISTGPADDGAVFTLNHFQIGDSPMVNNPGNNNTTIYIIIIGAIGGSMITTIAIKGRRGRKP